MDKQRDRRQEVYRTAARLFFEKGYNATSMRELASALGVEQATVYHYYPSKGDLLYAIMKNGIQDLTASVETALESTEDTIEKLTAGLTRHMSHFLKRREEAGLGSEIRNLNSEQRAELREINMAYVEKFRLLLDRGVKQGVFRPCKTSFVALLVLSSATSAAPWYRPDGPLTADEIATIYADVIMHGLLQNAKESEVVEVASSSASKRSSSPADSDSHTRTWRQRRRATSRGSHSTRC